MLTRSVNVALAALLLALTAAATPGVAHSSVETMVSIAGTVSGPSGSVRLGVNARGIPEDLTGTGGSAHMAFASPTTFEFDGTLDGSTVTLNGTVTHAAFEFLLGTPVTLTADATTDDIRLTFGPMPAGPLADQTLTFTGIGAVTISSAGSRLAPPSVAPNTPV